MTKISYLLLIIALISCSYTKREDLSSPVAANIEFDLEKKSSLPKLKKEVPSTGVGPIPSNEYIGKKSVKKRSAVVGLYLAPALFRSLSYLPLLSSLKQEGIKGEQILSLLLRLSP